MIRVQWVRGAVTLAVTLTLAGCSKTETSAPEAKEDPMQASTAAAEGRLLEAVRSGMKDPGSTQFRNVVHYHGVALTPKGDKVSMGMHSACGQVNAKNSFGAYVGFVDFVASEVEGKAAASVLVLMKSEYDSKYERELDEKALKRTQEQFCVQQVLQLQ